MKIPFCSVQGMLNAIHTTALYAMTQFLRLVSLALRSYGDSRKVTGIFFIIIIFFIIKTKTAC